MARKSLGVINWEVQNKTKATKAVFRSSVKRSKLTSFRRLIRHFLLLAMYRNIHQYNKRLGAPWKFAELKCPLTAWQNIVINIVIKL